MKKVFLALIIIISLLSIFSCGKDYKHDTFFDEAALEEYHLAGLPSPNLDNSRMIDGELYLNLTDSEYEAYVKEVADYLRERNDIYHLSYPISSGLIGEIVPYDLCAPLSESYDYSDTYHTFVFSMSEELEEVSDGKRLADPIKIIIKSCSEQLPFTDFSYNTEITLGAYSWRSACYDPCAAEHTYSDGLIYPIPGSGSSVTVKNCVICGEESRSSYASDGNQYMLYVSKGSELIKKSNTAFNLTPSGLIISIKICSITDSDISFKVNGEQIPPIASDSDGISFGFIMPKCAAAIEIESISHTDFKAIQFKEAEKWINNLSGEDIAEIKITKEIAGIAPGNFKEHIYTTSSDATARIFDAYVSAKLTSIPKEEAEIAGGLLLTVRFKNHSGELYYINLYSGIYRGDDGYYKLDSVPKITDEEKTQSTFSFITHGETDKYKVYGSSTLLGEYEGLGEFEFIEYTGPLPLIIPTTYIECDFGIMRIYNDTVFSFEANGSDGQINYYQLVGDKYFSFN